MRRMYLSYLGQSVELPDGSWVIGRDPGCRIRLHAASVSRRHARFVVDGDRVFLEDLESCNGTFVDGVRLAGRAEVTLGVEIRFGDRRMVLCDADLDDDFEPDTQVSQPPADEWAPDVTERIAVLAPAAERRRHSRYELEVPLKYESDDLQIEAVSRDLSRSGVFVRSPVLDQVGTRCRLTLSLRGRPLEVQGRVCRVVAEDSSDKSGLGIEFADLDRLARMQLEAVIAGLEQAAR
jgi:pSer/pThr/pTyr-binding forkhead associated (FHA) protein